MKSFFALAFAYSVVQSRSIRLAPVFSDGNVIENEYLVQLKQPDFSFASASIDADQEFSQFIDEHLGRAFGYGLAGFRQVEDRRINKFDAGYFAVLSEDDIDRLRLMPEVDFIEQNQWFQLDGASVVQKNPPSWGLDRISHRDLPLNQTYVYPGSAGKGVDVYVIDSGVRIDHQEFEGRAVWGFTAPGLVGDRDVTGHGTHCASTIAGKDYGVAKKANIIAVRCFEPHGATTVNILKAFDWVAKDHMEKSKRGRRKSVVNASFGGRRSNVLDSAVERAVSKGIHFAIAAGNEHQDACNVSPAGSPSGITVGATKSNDARAEFSNFGACVDIFAPGYDIFAADYTCPSCTIDKSGTSMAAPHVAGVMALLLGEKDYTPAELKQKLLSMATPDKVKDAGPKSPNLLLFNEVVENIKFKIQQ